MAKPYIGMNNDLRNKAKNYFEKYFFNRMNNAVFGKTMENIKKHKDIILVTIKAKRNYLVSELYNKIFSENLLAVDMRKTQIRLNKPVYVELSMLELSKTKIS